MEPGPLDALFDQESGNLIVAMGHEGLLVRTPNGAWHWIGLGPYVREDMRRVDQVWALLWGESVLALELAALVTGTLALLLRRPRVWGIVLGVIAWAVWIAAVILSPAMNASTYIEFPATIALIGAGLIALGWAIGSLVMTGRKAPGRLRAAAPPLALTALAGAVLFLLPYVLWVVGSVPRYSTAVVFGLLLAAAVVAAGSATAARTRKSR
jgi:hypothetical protein